MAQKRAAMDAVDAQSTISKLSSKLAQAHQRINELQAAASNQTGPSIDQLHSQLEVARRDCAVAKAAQAEAEKGRQATAACVSQLRQELVDASHRIADLHQAKLEAEKKSVAAAVQLEQHLLSANDRSANTDEVTLLLLRSLL